MVSNSRQESVLEGNYAVAFFAGAFGIENMLECWPRADAGQTSSSSVHRSPCSSTAAFGTVAQHATEPRRNGAWWAAKLAANVQRDRKYDAALVAAGWRVMRFWEHDDVTSMADQIEAAVRGS